MMETTVEKILEKILLPVSKGWEISGVSVDEQKQEIYVDLVYTSRSVFVDSSEYLVFDFRESRTWRHLDLWQYKTFLRARMPRYKTDSEVKTVAVPWADALERMTYLLEKKR
jgi:hypothetical protein